ncbi:hypothetical protein LTR43_012250, partial [Exophiala xenobiotica]
TARMGDNAEALPNSTSMSLNCKIVVLDRCGDVCLLLEVPSPVSETPTLDFPVHDAPTHDLSAEDAPADDIPVDDVSTAIPTDDVTLDRGDAAEASEHIMTQLELYQQKRSEAKLHYESLQNTYHSPPQCLINAWRVIQ